jgi:putative endonuclease
VKAWVAYLLRCGDGSLYAGITNDLPRRLAAHRGKAGASRGAKYTRKRGPFRLVWRQAAADRAEASRVEWRVKRLTRAEKLRLVRARGKIGLSPIDS